MLRTFLPRPAGDVGPYLGPIPAGSRWLALGWIAAGMRNAVRSRAERRRLHRAVRDLQALDDRMLKDIGVDRSEIVRVVWRGRRL